MKKLFLFLISISILFTLVGCEKTDNSGDEDSSDSESVESVADADSGDDIDEIEEDVDDDAEDEQDEIIQSNREDTVAQGSSELADDSGYGFSYNSVNVFDLDFSTAWCPEQGDENPTLTLSFPGKVELEQVGIVGGFGRDEAIFFQNNRLKNVEVWYDNKREAVGEFNFKDEYGMQFFEMPEGAAEQIKFVVKDVYAGSKYDDVCVAEVDFWSDWVDTKDAVAAENYYEKHKADFAVRPIGLKDLDMSLSPYTFSCGRVDYSMIDIDDAHGMGGVQYYHKTSKEFLYGYDGGHFNEFFFEYMEDSTKPTISAEMNQWAELGDKITIKWIKTSGFMTEDFKPVVEEVSEVSVKECPNGAYFVHDRFDSLTGLGSYVVKLYSGNKLIGSQNFRRVQ